MCAREAKEVGSESADQDTAEELRLRSSACSQLDQCYNHFHQPHTTVCPGCGVYLEKVHREPLTQLKGSLMQLKRLS